MARSLRVLYPGAVYQVMNRGLARQAGRGRSQLQQFPCEAGDARGIEAGAENS